MVTSLKPSQGGSTLWEPRLHRYSFPLSSTPLLKLSNPFDHPRVFACPRAHPITQHTCSDFLSSHTYCRDERPKNVYWAVGLVQEHLVVRGQIDVGGEVQISELWKDSGYEGLGRQSKEKCLLGITKQMSKRLTCHQEQCSRQFYW